MEENKIVESVRNKTVFTVLITVSAVVFVVGVILLATMMEGGYGRYSYRMLNVGKEISGIILTSMGLIFGLFILLIYFTKITVTDKRVYCQGILGFKMSMPIDSITSCGTFIFGVVFVGTSSAKFRWIFVSNKKEIHEEINKLIAERKDVLTNRK